MQLASFNYERPISKITNERQAIVKEFLDTLNLGREGTKYVKIWPKRLAARLGGIKTKDLYVLMSKCKDSKEFGQYFWWATRKENIQQVITGMKSLFSG